MSEFDAGTVQRSEIAARLEEIQQMATEYQNAAQERGETVNPANYRNLWMAVENLRIDVVQREVDDAE